MLEDELIQKMYQSLGDPDNWYYEVVSGYGGSFETWYSHDYELSDGFMHFYVDDQWGVYIESAGKYSKVEVSYSKRFNIFDKRIRGLRKRIKHMKSYLSNKTEQSNRKRVNKVLSSI